MGKLVVSEYNPMEDAKVQLSPADGQRLAIRLGAKQVCNMMPRLAATFLNKQHEKYRPWKKKVFS